MFFGFVLAGGIATALNLLVFYLMLLLGVASWTAAAVSYPLGIFVSFGINYFGVFRSQRRTVFVKSLLGYVISYMVSYVFVLSTVQLFSDVIGSNFFGYATVTGISVILSFFLVRRLAFRG